jgi:predicted Zn-dependent peptidase
MFLNSRFERKEIAKERNVIKEEIAMYGDEPQHLVQELLNATLWPDQPLGRPIAGTPATLDATSRPVLLNYLQQNYVSGSTVIVAAGKLKHAQVLRLVSKYARHFKAGARPQFIPSESQQQQARVRLCTKKTEQTQIALGIRTASRHDARRYALRLLNVILGENMSSRLFQVVREDRGLAYSIYSSPSFFHDTGDLVISAGLDADNLRKTIQLIVRELRHCADSPPPAGELRRARDYVLGQIDLGRENTETQMNWIGEQLIGYGRIFSIDEVKRRLRAVVPGDIRAVARDFFRTERLNLAIVSPLKSDRGLAGLLSI